MRVLLEKLNESFRSVLPIALIVLAVSIVLTPLSVQTFIMFIAGTVLLVVGMGLFNIGAETSMLTIGGKIGAKLTGSGKIWLIAIISFVLGMVVTIAEPDLRILADLVSGEIEPLLLIGVVGVGVGFFLAIAMLRIIFGVPLNVLLIIGYVAVFVLCFFVPKGFLAISFDAGGVTTGPMTVPFIMSLGLGVAAVHSGKNSGNDSFGLIALSSIGPIIAAQILGIIYAADGGVYVADSVPTVDTTRSVFFLFAHGLGDYVVEVAIALAPILVFFLLSQAFTRAFSVKQIVKILIGFVYTLVGLTVFLTGANVGFMPVGSELGNALATTLGGAFLIPVAMLLGYFVVAAEPAVHVLTKQVRRMSAGAISERSMRISLCIGVCISLGLAMMRVMTGISILWILIPGYAIAIVLSFFSPKMYTGIAFDSGGVASGATVSAFVLPMAIGACNAFGGDVFSDAFGCVAFVALTPLITIQILGIIHKHKLKLAATRLTVAEDDITEFEVSYDTEAI